ncbi:hypothetical protein [Dyella sp.]|uniref:hypothetical protein n=1 Tax=Dyella sp. TaxID=1869338 RepID=UPI002ED0857E
MTNGRLYYVMGPSEAGKDSVLGWVREHGVPLGVVCAHRYITGAVPMDMDPSRVPLSEQEFARRESRGLFVLTWKAHGHRFGIGREIEHWMNRGADVLVNGSRAAFGEALRRFPSLQPVMLVAHGQHPPMNDGVDDAVQAVPRGAWVIHSDTSLVCTGAQLLDAIRVRQAG